MKRIFAVPALAGVLLTGCAGGTTSSSSARESAAPVSAQDALTKAAVMTSVIAANADAVNNVKADVHDGNVTLTGAVRDAREEREYIEAAKRAPGVKSVSAKFTVDSRLRGARESLGEAALTARVAAALTAQAGVNAARVKPSARDGVVTLSGTAPTAAIKSTLLDTAKGVNGVRSVVDQIEVKP